MTYAGGHFQQALLFGITKKAGSEVQFAAKTTEVTIEGGKKPISIETLLNGGNLVNLEPGEMLVIKAKIYPAEIDEVDQFFLGDVSDSTQPLSATNALTMYEFRVAMLWDDGSTSSTASGTTGASDKAFRLYSDNGYMTECVPDTSGKKVIMNVVIEFPPFTSGAVGNLHRQSSDGTAAIGALAAYT